MTGRLESEDTLFIIIDIQDTLLKKCHEWERMVERSAEMGEYFLNRLREIDSRHIKEVRGLGLWIGLELNDQAGGARRFCEALQEDGLLCKETHATVIRIAPPLTITKEEIDWAFERIQKVLTTL